MYQLLESFRMFMVDSEATYITIFIQFDTNKGEHDPIDFETNKMDFVIESTSEQNSIVSKVFHYLNNLLN